MWAEWYRLLAEAGIPPHRALPRDLWRFRLDVEVADLSSERSLRRIGLAQPLPKRSEWAAFERVGERLHDEGWSGLVAPSAARPKSLVLCLFQVSGRFRGVRRLRPPRAVDSAPVPPRGMTT